MQYLYRIIIGLAGFGLVLVPIATSQGVTNIRLQAAPNTVVVEWSAPAGIAVDHYKIYYARESLLGNNGRFEDSEETPGDETTVVLFDLKNRGFSEGDVIFVTVTAIDTTGKEHMDTTEEASATVRIAAPAPLAPPLLTVPEPAPAPSPAPMLKPAPPVPLPDVTPPEDPGNLQLTFSTQPGGRYTVHASWEASLNTFGDLLSYNLYESLSRRSAAETDGDGGVRFIGPTALRATVLSAAIANVPPGTFTAKVTAMDRSGNESRGIVKSITLPETGGVALAVSIAGAALWVIGRKRRRA